MSAEPFEYLCRGIEVPQEPAFRQDIRAADLSFPAYLQDQAGGGWELVCVTAVGAVPAQQQARIQTANGPPQQAMVPLMYCLFRKAAPAAVSP